MFSFSLRLISNLYKSWVGTFLIVQNGSVIKSAEKTQRRKKNPEIIIVSEIEKLMSECSASI